MSEYVDVSIVYSQVWYDEVYRSSCQLKLKYVESFAHPCIKTYFLTVKLLFRP